MSSKADYVIYTASDPDAFYLHEHLEREGFIIPGHDLGDAAMVFVVEADGKKLKRVLKESGVESLKYWRVAKVGKGYKL